MSQPKLTDFKCLIFDCYGTLIDWETGILTAFQPLLTRYTSSTSTPPPSPADLLTLFAQTESQIQSAHPTMLYSSLLALTHSTIAKSHFNLPSLDDENAEFGRSIAEWEPFPDTREALRRLGRRYRLVVLSNVDRESFGGTLRRLTTSTSSSEGEGDGKFGPFDEIITAQDIGSYKPDLRNFRFALDRVRELWGVNEEEVIVTAQSLFHDHAPANRLGLRSSWIAREGAFVGSDLEVEGLEGERVTWTWKFGTLGEMADEVDRQFGGEV